MVELAGYTGLLEALNYLYWLVAAIALYFAWKTPSTRRNKIIATALVAVLFLGGPGLRALGGLGQRMNYAAAQKVFEERCKTAGEKIYAKAENVEGVYLATVREQDRPGENQNRSWKWAGLPKELGGNSYIQSFLLWEHNKKSLAQRGFLNAAPSDLPGYSYVDVKTSSGVVRYVLTPPPQSTLVSAPHEGLPSRYVVTTVPIDLPGDRELWIAGVRTEIRDSQSNKLMAEKVWYSFEPGSGNTSGGRQAWLFAKTCPSIAGWTSAPTRHFVDQVLKPSPKKNP
jgi:hypothetical protein